MQRFNDAPDSGQRTRTASRAEVPGCWSSVIQDIFDLMSTRPDATAVTDGDLEWSYATLRARSDAVARLLADRGVARGSVVGMHLPRCADAIAVMLGIMAYGCVYLPLDPSYPAARLLFMLDQAGVAAVISNDSDGGEFGPRHRWIALPGSPLPGPRAQPPTLPGDLGLRPEDHAYILFTSGSTGQPKGVMVTHRNISLMNEWSARFLGITEDDSSATSCSLSFDASFHEVLLPLSAGGTVHVIPHALALGQLARPVSLTATTPTVASELLRAGQLPPLRVLIVGGEALIPDVADRLLAAGRVGRLLNGYGPTECTVCVSMAEVTVPVPEVIPIGHPVPGTEILILGPDGQRRPDGERGEICVFGGQVTDGYVNDPAGTAERFLIGQEEAAGGRRYYRTGDLGYRGDDGSVYFAGRADRQVKLNGIRIELGEIDAALRSHPQVAEAATVVQDGARAVAYIVPATAGADVDLAGLRDFLADHLPRFMIPAGLVVLAELPKTVNGKLDTAALPEWSPGRPAGQLPALDELDEVTARVIEIVTAVTGFGGQVRPADDFIADLGGTSLGVVQVLTELQRYCGRRLRLNDALADTSVAGLASLLRAEAAAPAADFAFNPDGGAPPLFLVHSYLGSMLGLRRLAELLPPGQPAYGLYVHDDAWSGDQLTISELAASTLSRIREIQPDGQAGVVLAGHSAGGLIVLEVARQMLAAGDAEPRVLLMDTSRPYTRFDHYWGEAVLYYCDEAPPRWRELPGIAARVLLSAVTKPFRRRGPAGLPPQADDLMTLNARSLQSVVAAEKAYRVRPYQGRVTLMRTWQGRLMAMGSRSLGWSSVTAGPPEVIDVPGAHISMLHPPHVQAVAERLATWLAGGDQPVS